MAHKNLKKIVQFYIKNNPKVLKHFEIHDEEFEEIEEEDEQVEEEKPITKKRKHSKQQSNGHQQQFEDEEVQAQAVPKKKKKVQKEEEQQEPTTKVQKKKQVEQQQQKEEEEDDSTTEITKSVKNTDDIYYQNINGKKFFSKIDESRLQNIKDELKDNSFSAKFKFGKGDSFGQEGWERLKDKRGKEFKKEKNKLKNKNFCGGNFSIDPNVINSIKL